MNIQLPADVLNVLSTNPLVQITGLFSVTDGGTTYYLAEVDSDIESARFIVATAPGQAPDVLLADTQLVPSAPGVLPANVVAAFTGQFPAQGFRLGPDPQLQAAENQIRNGMQQYQNQSSQSKLYQCARLSAGILPSRNVPDTNSGRLACAWAVNEVARLALANPIGGGLSASDMFDVLRTSGRFLEVQAPNPGAVVISPTEGANVGHVGLVGANDQIYSNSSALGLFEQNYDIPTWQGYYQGKGLSVHFFNLNFA